MLNVSIDWSSLNIFSSLLSQLLQVKERTNDFLKMNDIFEFLHFLYLPQKIQWIFFILTFLDFI